MTVEQLKDKMRAEGMDPDTAKFQLSDDGTVDIVVQPDKASRTIKGEIRIPPR